MNEYKNIYRTHEDLIKDNIDALSLSFENVCRSVTRCLSLARHLRSDPITREEREQILNELCDQLSLINDTL